MHLRRVSGTIGLAVATILFALLPEPVDARPDRASSFSFAGTCRDVSGELRVQQSSTGAKHTRLSLRARGVRDQRWYVELAVQPGRTMELANFMARAKAGRLHRAAAFGAPAATGVITGSLFDFDRQVGCKIQAYLDDRSIAVSAGVELYVSAPDGERAQLTAGAACPRGETWRLRGTATYADRVSPVRASGRCRHGSLGRTILELPERGLPRAMKVAVHDSAGHVERASYRLRR